MKRITLAAALLVGLSGRALAAADYSASLTAGATVTTANTLTVPAALPSGSRKLLRIINAAAASSGAASGWCTWSIGIIPGPGVPGSYEIAAGSSGEQMASPGVVHQGPVTCAPSPNSTVTLTIVTIQ